MYVQYVCSQVVWVHILLIVDKSDTKMEGKEGREVLCFKTNFKTTLY